MTNIYKYMKGWIFLIVGLLLSVLSLKKFIIINVWWILACFALWLLFLFISIHNKNKEINTPKPVYVINK